MEWRLRLTGTKVAFITGATWLGEHGDYPSDPRQSTLYNWWKIHANTIGNLEGKAKELDVQINNCLSELKNQKKEGENPNWETVRKTTAEFPSNVNSLINAIKEVDKAINAARIPISLERFDKWFLYFLRSQNMRWFVIEFGLPILLGIFAILLLTSH
jgi:hypothetical protein